MLDPGLCLCAGENYVPQAVGWIATSAFGLLAMTGLRCSVSTVIASEAKQSRNSHALYEILQHHFATGFIKFDRQLVAIDQHNRAIAELQMKNATTFGEARCGG